MNTYRVWLTDHPTVTAELVPADSGFAARQIIAQRDGLDVTDLCYRLEAPASLDPARTRAIIDAEVQALISKWPVQ